MAGRILHVYPEKMRHHTRNMIPNHNSLFFDSENIHYLVISDASTTAMESSYDRAICGRGIDFLMHVVSYRYSLVIFHSAFWPKFWIYAIIVALCKRCCFVSWGGDLDAGRDFKHSVVSILRRMALPMFEVVVFLAKSDAERALASHRMKKYAIIPYFNPAYLVSRYQRNKRSSLRFQVGNDASQINGHLECLRYISEADDGTVDLVLPLGYGRFREEYIVRLKGVAKEKFGARAKCYDELLPLSEFDALIDTCDAFVMASREQRALYSVYRFLASGRPVFLSSESIIWKDIVEQGFKVFGLEQIEIFIRNGGGEIWQDSLEMNRQNAGQLLSRESVRRAWSIALAQDAAK